VSLQLSEIRYFRPRHSNGGVEKPWLWSLQVQYGWDGATTHRVGRPRDLITRAEAELMEIAMRELIRLPGRAVSSIALVVDFGWLLVVHGGSLLAFNLHTMIPTSDPSTWSVQGKSGAVKISSNDHSVAFVRMGYTKDRLMGE
jgi:hypothetical protein